MRIYTFIICFILSFSLYAQHDVYVGGSLMGGIPFNQYKNGGQELYSRKISSVLGASFFLQYRLSDRFAIEGGLNQTIHKLRMQDKKFAERNPGFQVRLSSTNSYWSYYGALSYAQPISSKAKIYSTVGFTINQGGSGQLSESKNFVVAEENVTLKNNYQNKNSAIFLEVGYEKKISDRVSWFMGLRFNKGLSNLTEGEYTVEKNGEMLSLDSFITNSGFAGLNTGLKINVFHKDKSVKKPKEPPVQKTKDIQVETLSDKKIEGRALVVEHHLTVKNATVTILVWDDQKVDGDRISLNVNGNWVAKDYTLEKQKKAFVVTLKPGQNVVVLHALNLGKIKPNTAAVLVDDGITQQKLRLESDMENSGTLIIDYK